MRFRCSIVLAFFAFSSCLTGCGRVEVQSRPVTKITQTKEARTVQVRSATSKAGDVAAALKALRSVALYAAAIQVQRQPPTPLVDPEPPVTFPLLRVTGVAAASSMPCGGSEYPPCYVAQRESGNTYDAFNPTGCGGNACYGRWQFSGAWAGKLGLPSDLSTATAQQQDEAARELWAGGSGCSNWDACNG